VFVVEHDLDLMRRAQWLADVGPAAGEQGGHILYSGVPEGLKAIAESRTARYLFDEIRPPQSYARTASRMVKITGYSPSQPEGTGRLYSSGVLDRCYRYFGFRKV
jgi:excinuclease ABC subunit A